MGTYFNSIFREGFSHEMTFEQRPVGGKEGTIQIEGISYECKEVYSKYIRLYFACLRSSSKNTMGLRAGSKEECEMK